jgi:hypothetical protein
MHELTGLRISIILELGVIGLIILQLDVLVLIITELDAITVSDN